MGVSESEFRRIEKRLDGLEETVDILADKKLLGSIKKSLDEIKSGKYKDYVNANEFKRRFNSRA